MFRKPRAIQNVPSSLPLPLFPTWFNSFPTTLFYHQRRGFWSWQTESKGDVARQPPDIHDLHATQNLPQIEERVTWMDTENQNVEGEFISRQSEAGTSQMDGCSASAGRSRWRESVGSLASLLNVSDKLIWLIFNLVCFVFFNPSQSGLQPV